MPDHTPQQGHFIKGDVVEVRNGPCAAGRKVEACEAIFPSYVREEEFVVKKTMGRNTRATIARNRVHRGSRGASAGIQHTP